MVARCSGDAVGVGFAAFESMGYALNFFTDGTIGGTIDTIATERSKDLEVAKNLYTEGSLFITIYTVSSDFGSRRNGIMPIKVMPLSSCHGFSWRLPVITTFRKLSLTWRKTLPINYKLAPQDGN